MTRAEKGRRWRLLEGILDGIESAAPYLGDVRTLAKSLHDKLESGVVGRIFLRTGQVVSARLDARPDLDGRQSVYAMLMWRAGAFSFNAMEVDMEDTVQSSTTHLLMEGARLIDEANRDAEG